MGITTTTTTTTRTMKIAAVVAVAVDDNVFFDPVVSQLRHSTNRELKPVSDCLVLIGTDLINKKRSLDIQVVPEPQCD
ncbi:hypothetical protein BLOT_004863 [Blomia tropicalis]|nr:hypothetical protein BLOT_004863 [Blomia tropicalis]